MNYADLKPTKTEEQTHIQRKFRLWHKYWLNCKGKEKKARYFNQTMLIGEMMEKELFNKYKGR